MYSQVMLFYGDETIKTIILHWTSFQQAILSMVKPDFLIPIPCWIRVVSFFRSSNCGSDLDTQNPRYLIA